MEKLQFSTIINATKKKVWQVLWDDATLRQWAGIVDPGTYMKGQLAEGNQVQFLSESGYGVTSLVAKLVPFEYILFKHKADTQDDGLHSREDQWTGGEESYTLKQSGDNTTLTLVFDVPTELVSIMNTSYPKALDKIKELSEQ